eukprot:357816-Chlamydomonas_euryale.AAC.2
MLQLGTVVMGLPGIKWGAFFVVGHADAAQQPKRRQPSNSCHTGGCPSNANESPEHSLRNGRRPSSANASLGRRV